MLNEIPFRTVWRHITSIEKPVLRGAMNWWGNSKMTFLAEPRRKKVLRTVLYGDQGILPVRT